METFSALLAICAGNSPVPGEFPVQRPVTRSFDVRFDLRLNKRLSKQSWGWWFETPSLSLWRHRNASNGHQTICLVTFGCIAVSVSRPYPFYDQHSSYPRKKSPVSWLFTQPSVGAQIKENPKAPRHWPLCGKFTGDRWIPRTKDSNAENVSICNANVC